MPHAKLKTKLQKDELDEVLYREMQLSPLLFIEKMWGLTPERDNAKFRKNVHITWQQHDILLAVEAAIQGRGKKRISVRSGHGIGKSTVLSWLILWYLFCFPESQIPCTAPTSEQMHDVLWKEIAKWLEKMPSPVKAMYEWSQFYIRMKESPEIWFARAKTARKDKPEALAGVHGDHVMFIVDEASGVPDEIFSTAEGALTGLNVLLLLISNPTRLIGYFYDTHRSDAKAWQTLAFSSKDSPIVEPEYETRIIEKYGEDSDEYKIRVLGEFPSEDTMDEAGYVQMFLDGDLKKTKDTGGFIGDIVMGIDPAGEGDDETKWVIRDSFKAKIVATEKVSSPKSIAQKTLTLMDLYRVEGGNVYVDNFGIGANVSQELALAGVRVNGVNVGEAPFDQERFLNLRAEAYWKAKQWLREGGELVTHDGWDELLFIRQRKELNGKMKVMSKRDMKKMLGKSPDHADAFMLTFVRPTKRLMSRMMKQIQKHITPVKKSYTMKMA